MNQPDLPVHTHDFNIPIDDFSLKARWLKVENEQPQHPVLIFLHDSLGCIELWRDFPEKVVLSTGCSALIYDRRGYGQSSPFGTQKRGLSYLEEEARVLARVMEHCAISNAILFGHSDGGSIALVAAAEYPQHIRAIVTEGAHVFVEEITLQGIRAAVAAYQSTSLPEKLARYHGSKTEAVFSAWTDTWLAPSFRNWNIEGYLPKIQCPVLVLQGDEDEFGSDKQVYAIGGQVSGSAATELIPNTQHSPHKESPEFTLRLTTEFISKHLP